MPSKCFVSGCRSNYCSEPKVRVFSFPRDEILKNQWLRAIQREDKRQPSKASKVCALHFKAGDIITEASGFNSKTQEFITVPLQKHRLKPDAVPSIFNNLSRTRKKTWKKISRKTHDRSNIQLLEGSQECIPNSGPSMQSRHSRSSSDISKYSDESPTKKTQASPTTDKPFITVIKPEDSRLGEPTSPEAVGEDSSSCSEVLNSSNKSSPNTKTNPNSLPSPYKHFPSVSVCLKEEDRLNVQRELDKPVKRTASVSSNNSTGSNEVSKLQPKRRKIEKPAPTVIGRQNDCYCWVCHRENVTLLCIACPRAFHQKCAGDQVVSSNEPDWVCPECKRILTAERVDTRSSVLAEISLDKLCTLLRFSLNKMKHRAGVAFHQPVSLEHYPMYHHYVIHPMDFSLLEKNIKQKLYGCTETFLADVKWILHNSCVFNGSQHPLSTNAKSLVKTCDNDMQEIEVCPDCFMHSIVRNKYWFSEVCRKPHPLVWAKLKGFPYWPAKVVQIADNGTVDARFFGAHDRAWVAVSQCYHLSKEMPTSSKPKKKGNYETALDELNVHVQLLIQKFGKFEYASYRTSFDPDNKFLAYHGINIDKIDKEEIYCDVSTSESNDVSSNGAENEASVKLVKDTEKYRNIQKDIRLSNSNVSSQNDNSSETKNVNNPSATTENDKNDTKLTDETDKPVSDSNQLKKIELVLQKIKGYILTADDEEDNEGKNAGPKENVTELKDNSAVDATINKPDSLPNVKDDSKKEGNEDISFITGLIKSKTLPSIEIPSIEEDSEKEKAPILDVTKKNDSFSLKLIETIESCKAKLGLSGSELDKIDSGDSDYAEDEEEEYEEEDEDEEHEVEDEEEHEVEDEEEHEVEDEEEHEVEDEEEQEGTDEDHDLEDKDHDLEDKDHDLEDKDHDLEDKDHDLEDKDHDLEDKDHDLEDKDHDLEDKDHDLEDKDHELEDKDHELEDKDHELEDKDHELEDKDHELEDKDHELEDKEREVEDKKHAEGKDDYHLEQKSRKKIKIDTNLFEEEANEESTSEMEVEGNSNCSDTDIEMIDEVESSATNYTGNESNNHLEGISINDRKNYTECKETVDHKEINDLSDQNVSNVLLKKVAENKILEKESIIEDAIKSGNLETEYTGKRNENSSLKDELTVLDLQLNESERKIGVSEEVMENQQEKGTIPELEKKIVKETDCTIDSLISDNKNSGKKVLEEEQMEDDDIFICNSPPEKPPTPPLICLDDGNETDESENDEKLDSLVNKSDIKISRTINSEADRLSSVFGVTKLPTSARKSMKRVFKTKSTDGDSSEEDIRIVSSCKGVPLSGAKRTFNNREKINPMGGNVSASGDEMLSNNIQHNDISIAREEIIGGDEWNIQNINKSNVAILLNGEFQSTVEEASQNSVSEPSNIAEKDEEILRLKKKLGCVFSAVQWQHWKHGQEKAELRHNMNLIIMEMRAALEADKKQAIETLTQTLEREKQRCIEEVKKKQWCAFCHQESRYACCWNTSYCTIACQKRHFPEHRNICTQLKKLSAVEAPDIKTKAPTTLNDGKENKKVLVLNVLPPSDSTKSSPAVINQKETVQQVSISKIMPSKAPIHLVSSSASPSSTTVQFVLAPIKSDNSLVPIQPKPIAPKPDNSDPSQLQKNSVKQGNNSLSLLKKNNPEDVLSPQINAEKAKETNLEDIYFPSPPRISFEGLDTAIPDDNIQFIDMKDTTESCSSDAEQAVGNKTEDSSEEEDIIMSDGDDTDNELVNIGRGVEIFARYLNKCLIYGKSAKRLTRYLVDVIFPDVKLLATCSAFGNKSNVTKLTRAALPARKVEAIIDFVLKRFPYSSRSEIVLAINMKCKEARDILGRSGDGNVKKTLFRRLLAKGQQKRETGQATASNTDNSTKAPTTVTLVKKNLNLVCVQNSSVSESSTSDKSKITNKTTTGPNIFRCSPQLLIRPKISVPSVGPRLLVGPTTKLVRDTTKPLLSSSQPLNNGTKYNGKILLPLEVKKTPTIATAESINSQSKPLIQRPYIILGSATSTSSQPGSAASSQSGAAATSQPGAAKISQLEISTASQPDALTASQLEQSESSATKMKSDDQEKIAALRTKRAEYMRNYRRAQREKQTDEEVSQHRASEAQRLRKYRQTQNV